MAPDRFDALIESARAGGEAAWSEIWGELSPDVLAYLRGSRVLEPEDVLSEVFLQVARDIGRFDGSWDRFRGWVFAIAHHRLIDAHRYKAVRPVELVAEPPEPPGESAEDAADVALRRIGDERVRRVLDSLTPDQQAVLLMRIVSELSLEQTAQALGKRVGAVKQLQRRGLAAIGRALAEERVTL